MSQTRIVFIAFLALWVASCAAPVNKTPKKVEEQVTFSATVEAGPVVRELSSRTDRELQLSQNILGSVAPSEQNAHSARRPEKRFPSEDNRFPVFQKREFLFGANERHDFQRQSSNPEKRMRVFDDRWTWDEGWMIFGGILTGLLLASLAWRGAFLVLLFLRLWRRERSEELFGQALVGQSSLAPPVSLMLFSESPNSDWLSQVSGVERMDYSEAEMIIFRDIQSKDEDALLLKDFRLRYRSPLYFADLESEDPYEILEVQGQRRILIVYSRQKDLRTALVLFLKLARYPLVGFLKEETELHPAVLNQLVFRWLREGNKRACVYGFVEKGSRNPIESFLNPIVCEGQWLTGMGGSPVKEWFEENDIFCLMPKSLAIQAMDQGWNRWDEACPWTEIPAFETAGLRRDRGNSWSKTFASFSRILSRSLKNGCRFSRNRGWTLIANQISWILAVSVWPLSAIFARDLSGPLFLAALSEVLLLMFVLLIRNLFLKGSFRNICPPPKAIQIREKLKVPA